MIDLDEIEKRMEIRREEGCRAEVISHELMRDLIAECRAGRAMFHAADNLRTDAEFVLASFDAGFPEQTVDEEAIIPMRSSVIGIKKALRAYDAVVGTKP